MPSWLPSLFRSTDEMPDSQDPSQDPSQEDPVDATPDDDEPVNPGVCVCGVTHKNNPKMMPNEFARLSHSFADPECRPALSRLIGPRTRPQIDAGEADPWIEIAKKFNDPNFKPDTFITAAEVANIDPKSLVHTRSAAYLKAKWNQVKALLTQWQNNYTASGNHDADNRASFVTNGNMGMYYAWLFLEATSTLDAFIRELPDGIGAEDGSGAASNPATNKKKRRRSGIAIPPAQQNPSPLAPTPADDIAALTSALAANRTPERVRRQRESREETKAHVDFLISLCGTPGVARDLKERANLQLNELLTKIEKGKAPEEPPHDDDARGDDGAGPSSA